jgi:hypothetical protein
MFENVLILHEDSHYVKPPRCFVVFDLVKTFNQYLAASHRNHPRERRSGRSQYSFSVSIVKGALAAGGLADLPISDRYIYVLLQILPSHRCHAASYHRRPIKPHCLFAFLVRT